MATTRQDLQDALVREMPWYVSAAVRFQIAVADQLGMPVAAHLPASTSRRP